MVHVDPLITYAISFLALPLSFVFLLVIAFFVTSTIFVGPEEVVVCVNVLTGTRRELKTGVNLTMPFLEYAIPFTWTQRQVGDRMTANSNWAVSCLPYRIIS
jgi:hypothetical protein